MKYLISLFALIVSSLVFSVSVTSGSVHAQATCGFGGYPDIEIIEPDDGEDMDVEQTITLEASAVGLIESVTFVFDSPDGFKVVGIGEKEPVTGSEEYWTMVWDTRFSMPFSPGYELRADVEFLNGDHCQSPAIYPRDVTPQEPVDFALVPDPWTGPTNVVKTFTLVPTVNVPAASEILDFLDTEWNVQGVGTITQVSPTQVEFSSPVAGQSTIEVTVRYAGLSATRSVNVTVVSQYSSSSGGGSGSGSNPGSSGTSDEDPGEPLVALREPAVEPAEAFAQVIEASNELESCLNSTLGESVVQQVRDENRRPSNSEFKQYQNCFAAQDYVIPNILAPVAPEDVQNKRETSDVRVEGINNRKKRLDDGKEITTLVLSGMAKPNSDVLIYIFSEPLVLAATADENGNWEYVLEDPLPGGEHEVYALIDRGDGEYERSSLASFFIGTAEATEENPNGYSLELIAEPTITANNRSANIFIASTIAITVFVVTAFSGFLIYRFRNKDSGGSGGLSGPSDGQMTSTDTAYKA